MHLDRTVGWAYLGEPAHPINELFVIPFHFGKPLLYILPYVISYFIFHKLRDQVFYSCGRIVCYTRKASRLLGELSIGTWSLWFSGNVAAAR